MGVRHMRSGVLADPLGEPLVGLGPARQRCARMFLGWVAVAQSSSHFALPFGRLTPTRRRRTPQSPASAATGSRSTPPGAPAAARAAAAPSSSSSSRRARGRSAAAASTRRPSTTRGRARAARGRRARARAAGAAPAAGLRPAGSATATTPGRRTGRLRWSERWGGRGRRGGGGEAALCAARCAAARIASGPLCVPAVPQAKGCFPGRAAPTSRSLVHHRRSQSRSAWPAAADPCRRWSPRRRSRRRLRRSWSDAASCGGGRWSPTSRSMAFVYLSLLNQ